MSKFLLVCPGEPFNKFLLPHLSEDAVCLGRDNMKELFGAENLNDGKVKTRHFAVMTHPGLSEFATFLQGMGVRVFNGGPLADKMHSDPDFVTVEAAKCRTLVTDIDCGGEIFNLAVLYTKHGPVNPVLQYEEHTKLFDNINLKTEEGITLRTAYTPDDDFPKFLNPLNRLICDTFKYTGFIFYKIQKTLDGNLHIRSLSPYGPPSFWPAFVSYLNQPLGKLVGTALSSRRAMHMFMTKSGIQETVKVTIPPYPYTVCEWIPSPHREEVEKWMKEAANGIKIEKEHFDSEDIDIVYIDVKQDVGGPGYITTGPAIAYVTGSTDSIRDKMNLWAYSSGIGNFQTRRLSNDCRLYSQDIMSLIHGEYEKITKKEEEKCLVSAQKN